MARLVLLVDAPPLSDQARRSHMRKHILERIKLNKILSTIQDIKRMLLLSTAISTLSRPRCNIIKAPLWLARCSLYTPRTPDMHDIHSLSTTEHVSRIIQHLRRSLDRLSCSYQIPSRYSISYQWEHGSFIRIVKAGPKNDMFELFAAMKLSKC